MIRVSWLFVDIVSRLLEPDEREFVRGDFAESGETGGRALRDLLGLVVRRQAALWKDWRSWLALLGLIVPIGLLLSEISFRLRFLLQLHLRTYWRHGVRYSNGLPAPEQTVLFFCQVLALFAWS